MRLTLLSLKLLVAMALILPSPLLFAETVERVVAIVNEEPITLYELDKAMSRDYQAIQSSETGVEKKGAFKNSKSQALKYLISEKLLEQELKKKKIEVTQADEEKAIQTVLDRNKMTLDQLKKEIQSKGQSWEQYKEAVKDQLKRIRFMGQVLSPRVSVTDADLEDFFASNSDKFAQFQTVELAQIIIPLEPDASTAALSEAQGIANEVLKKARGGSNFEELGTKYSKNPQTAIKDNYPVAQLAPQIQATIAEMKPGQVGDPVRSALGIHIIKLFGRSTLAGEEFQAIKEQVREKVYQLKLEEEMENYLDDLKDQSYIEIKA